MDFNCKEYAEYYFGLGFNVTCITNKKTPYNANSKRYKAPSNATSEFFERRQTYSELLSYSWENSIGVGTMCGQIFIENGRKFYLTVLDFDGISLSALEDVLEILNLPADYEWVVRTGSQLGFHIYFLSQYSLIHHSKMNVISYENRMLGEPIVYFDRVEVLIKNHSVLPPSLHASTFKYNFINCELPRKKPQIIYEDTLLSFIVEACHSEPVMILSDVYSPMPYTDKKTITDDFGNPLIPYDDIASIVIDIETDGLITNNIYPNILQIAFYCLDKWNNIIKKEFFAISNSNKDFINPAYEINKLDIMTLNAVGYELSDALKYIYQYLKYCTKAICYNKLFDLSILNYYLNQHGYTRKFDIENSFCVMENYSIFKNNSDYVKLEIAFHEFISKRNIISHNAEIDVYKTYLIYRKLIKKMQQ
jgi:hypothetical protein